MKKLEEVNIVLYVVMTMFTLGLFYLYWQHRQMQASNILLGRKDHGLFKWMLLSIITLGIYHFYHEYKLSMDIIEMQEMHGTKVNSSDYPILCLIVSIFGFFFISDIIHQEDLNKIIKKVNTDPSRAAFSSSSHCAVPTNRVG